MYLREIETIYLLEQARKNGVIIAFWYSPSSSSTITTVLAAAHSFTHGQQQQYTSRASLELEQAH